MDTTIQLIQAPDLFNPNDRKAQVIAFQQGHTLEVVTSEARANLIARGLIPVVVVNGYRVDDLSRLVQHGDFVVVQSYYGGGGVGRIIAMVAVMVLAIAMPYLMPAAMVAGLGGMFGVTGATAFSLGAALITGATMLVGGLLVSALMPIPTPSVADSKQDNTPTYNWNGPYNPTQPGTVIPIVVGEVIISPVVFDYYLEVTEGDHNTWAYYLLGLAVGAGYTDATGATPYPITYLNDINVGKDKLSNFRNWTANYTYGIENGQAMSTCGFNVVHNYRTMSKMPGTGPLVTTENLTVLTLCHGEGAATNEAGYGPDWYATGSAGIASGDGKFGSGCFNFYESNSYYANDNYNQLRCQWDFTFEFWFKKNGSPATGNHAIAGQWIMYPEIISWSWNDLTKNKKQYSHTGWGMWYDSYNGQFVVQSWHGQGISQNVLGADAYIYYTSPDPLIIQLTAAEKAVLDGGDWGGHVCLINRGGTIRGYYDGNYRGEATWAVSYPSLFSALFGEAPEQWINQNASAYFVDEYDHPTTRLGYCRRVPSGMSNYYATFNDIYTEEWGYCKLDEIRMTYGSGIYSWAGFTPPDDVLGLTVTSVSSDVDNLIIETQNRCDRVRVMIEFPNGLGKVDPKNPEQKVWYADVDFAFSWRKKTNDDSELWVTEPTFTLTGDKFVSMRFQRYVPEASYFPTRDQYEVVLSRLTESKQESKLGYQDKAVITGFDELVNHHLWYPGVQVLAVGIQADENNSGSLPALSVRTVRDYQYIPTWDDEADAYGKGYCHTKNAAKAARMIMCDQFRGRGKSISDLDETSWKLWETRCENPMYYDYPNDTTVYYRSLANGVWDSAGNLRDNGLSQLELIGRARILPIGSKHYVFMDKPLDDEDVLSYMFSAGNMIPGSFSWENYEQSEKCDEVEVEFMNLAKGSRDSRSHRATWYDYLTRPPNVTKVFLKFINNPVDALRHAIFIMQKTEWAKRRCQFNVDIEACHVQPGDKVWVVPPTNRQMFSGRLPQDSSGAHIRIDQTITLDTATYGAGAASLILRDKYGNTKDNSDNPYKYTIVGAFDTPTDTIEVDSGDSAMPSFERFDVWAIVKPNVDMVKYTVDSIGIDSKSPDKMEVVITCINYDYRAYYHDDFTYGGVVVPI